MTAPLHYAAERGHEEIVKILVEHGSNMDFQDRVLIFFFFSFLLCYGFDVLFYSFFFNFFLLSVE